MGWDSDVEAAVELLLGQRDQRDTQVLAVTGAAGVGKTALAKMVFNDARVQEKMTARRKNGAGRRISGAGRGLGRFFPSA